MSFSVKYFHEFLVKQAIKIGNIYDAIVEMDAATILYYCKHDTIVRYNMRKLGLMLPDKIDMNYLYNRLDQEYDHRKINVVT